VSTSHDFVRELESGKFDHLKDQPVVTYCTGGVRCEILSSMMIKRGFKEVYQLDGGIVRYGETYADEGLWEGSLYIFDKRKAMTFSDNATIISSCVSCAQPTSQMENCDEPSCRQQMVLCGECVALRIRCNDHTLISLESSA
jgi:UPF0176 protein